MHTDPLAAGVVALPFLHDVERAYEAASQPATGLFPEHHGPEGTT